MFRKLVSNLPFSPALVGQLGFYAKRLKREEATRRLGLVFTVLALIVQSFAVITPPESANASNGNDLIYGGVTTKEQLLATYDRSARGNGDYKDILDYAGITRAELAAARDTSINSKQYGTGSGAWLSWGRHSRFTASQGEATHVVPRAAGGTSTVYSRPLWRYDNTAYEIQNGTTHKAFVGVSAKIGAFAIMKGCGNIVTRTTPSPVPEGAFIQATCDVVRGYAFDARNKNLKVSVYLYFNGPPGKGERVGPILANGSNNTFTYSVPQKYRTSRTATQVWGVLVPLAGWSQSTVQFKNTVSVPGNCIAPQPVAAASCSALKVRVIERTKFALTATASAVNGATVKGYTFTVKDNSGKVVTDRKITTTALQADSGIFELKNADNYTSSVVVHTSLGDRTGGNCTAPLTVATLAMCPYNATLPKGHEDCKPCPGNSELWVKDQECQPSTALSKEARNLTQGADATTTTAQGGDRIQYTVYVENIGKVPATVTFTEELGDVVEYATIQDNGGGTFNNESKVLSWGTISLAPGERQSRAFVINVKNDVPATPRGASEPSSYDCVMTNAFGNTVTINVNCPQVKMVEQTVSQLPSTGPGENLLFSGVVLSIVTFFWARSRQLNKEVRLIRKDFNMGTI